MSPYIKAYEAGVKLAQLSWMRKVADKERAYSDPDDGGDMSVPMPEESESASEGNTYSDVLRNFDTEYLGGMGSRAYDSISDYFSGGGSGSELAGPPAESMNAEGGVVPYANAPGASQGYNPPNYGEAAGSGEFPGMEQAGGVVPYANAPGASQGYNPPNYGGAAGSGQFPGMEQAGGVVPYANAPGAPQGFNPPNYGGAAGSGQFPGMEQAGRGNAPEASEQAEAAPDPFNFNVVKGGYGKQFRALQQAFKDRGQEDALEGFNYRDMAQAMGNRGLRENDRFDANALLQRMRNIQDQGVGVMEGTQFNVQRQQGRGKQRGYRDIGNFQTLQQQRAAANRARPSQGANMPKARPGQFSNTELKSPMQAPAIAPQLTLGSNSPGIGTGGFYNPQSAAKPSPTGLNMSVGSRLNTSKQVRPFDQYED